MEINEKTLKAFITKRKKNIIEVRREGQSENIYHWYCGYQNLLWELEMFLEGEVPPHNTTPIEF